MLYCYRLCPKATYIYDIILNWVIIMKDLMKEIAEFDTIKKLSDIIAKAVKPLQIYLFGSFARNEQKESSDVDL